MNWMQNQTHNITRKCVEWALKIEFQSFVYSFIGRTNLANVNSKYAHVKQFSTNTLISWKWIQLKRNQMTLNRPENGVLESVWKGQFNPQMKMSFEMVPDTLAIYPTSAVYSCTPKYSVHLFFIIFLFIEKIYANIKSYKFRVTWHAHTNTHTHRHKHTDKHTHIPVSSQL